MIDDAASWVPSDYCHSFSKAPASKVGDANEVWSGLKLAAAN